MERRAFTRWAALAAGAVLLQPAVALAERRRILSTAEDPLQPLVGREGSAVLRQFLGGVRVGAVQAHDGLAVVWLHATPASEPFEIDTLGEARAHGAVVITERGEASVSTLLADNRGKRHVLLLAGEIVLGGKQNRVVAEDVLLPPTSGPRVIPVFCVEQGRWAQRTTEFSGAGSFAAPALRAHLAARPSQAKVWAEVDRYAYRTVAPSPTRSYQAVFDKPEMRAHQEAVARAIDAKPPADSHGAAVFIGERFSGLDLFQAPSLFAREWPMLLRAQAIETYDRAGARLPADATLQARAKELIAAAADATGTARPGAGVGTLFEFAVSGSRGTALLANQVIHTAVL